MLDFPHHSLDPRMLLMQDAEDLPALSDDFLKGALLEDAMPEDVAEFLLSSSDQHIGSITNKKIPIDSSGQPVWSDVKRGDIPECFLNFTEKICPAFNAISDRPALLTLSRDKGSLASIFPRFHFDSRDVHDHATMRAVMSVSNDDLDHETEWIATDNLSEENLGRLLTQTKHRPISDLGEELARHVQTTKQRELIAFKGLSRFRSNPLIDGCAHRAPPFKNAYRDQGLRRMSVVLDEVIDWGNDFDY